MTTAKEDWTHIGGDLLSCKKKREAGCQLCIAGSSCASAVGGLGKRLSRKKVLGTKEVVVQGKRKKVSQSIQCTEPGCGVLCCVASAPCMAQMLLHFERHIVRKKTEISIEELRSSALYWRYFFAQDFDDEKRARAAVVDLLQRKQFMDFHLSHSDVNSCSKCKTTLGPAVFLDKKLYLCLKCFMVVAKISAEDAFRHEDKCFSRW